LLVAVDLGGTWIRASVVSPDGLCAPLVRKPSNRRRPREEIMADLVATIKAACENANVELRECEGVAVGVPGIVDNEGRLVKCGHLPTMSDFDLGEDLRKRIGLPVRIFNDALCFAVGEWWMGVGKGTRNFCGVTIGTGLGVGIVVDGRPYRGTHGYAGEIYGTPFGTGCLGASVSGGAIEREYRKLFGQNLGGDEIAVLAKAGDPKAMAVFKEFGTSLGRAISFLVNVIDPEVVAFGGSVSQSFDLFRDAFVHAVMSGSDVSAKIRFERSILGEEAALLGAGKLFWD